MKKMRCASCDSDVSKEEALLQGELWFCNDNCRYEFTDGLSFVWEDDIQLDYSKVKVF